MLIFYSDLISLLVGSRSLYLDPKSSIWFVNIHKYQMGLPGPNFKSAVALDFEVTGSGRIREIFFLQNFRVGSAVFKMKLRDQ